MMKTSDCIWVHGCSTYEILYALVIEVFEATKVTPAVCLHTLEYLPKALIAKPHPPYSDVRVPVLLLLPVSPLLLKVLHHMFGS
jgi:hypothetical protein